jgi:hypothetical protein
MTEFTAEWIKQWRFLNTPIKDTFCISALIFSEALDEIERLQKENKELKEFVDATRPTGICEICTSNVISRYEPLQARVQELEQERRWIPVSERLPEEEGEYWVCYFYDNKTIQGYCDYKLKDGFENALAWDNTEIVTHWQPLPQPPQEGE